MHRLIISQHLASEPLMPSNNTKRSLARSPVRVRRRKMNHITSNAKPNRITPSLPRTAAAPPSASECGTFCDCGRRYVERFMFFLRVTRHLNSERSGRADGQRPYARIADTGRAENLSVRRSRSRPLSLFHFQLAAIVRNGRPQSEKSFLITSNSITGDKVPHCALINGLNQ